DPAAALGARRRAGGALGDAARVEFRPSPGGRGTGIEVPGRRRGGATGPVPRPRLGQVGVRRGSDVRSGALPRRGSGARPSGREFSQAGTAAAVLAPSDDAVDDDLTAPHAPGLPAGDSTFEALLGER